MSVSAGFVRIVHFFHPLCGQRFEVIGIRKNRNRQWVYFYDDEGQARSVPVSWTNLFENDAYAEAGGGQVYFRIPDLLELADLVDFLKETGSVRDA